MGVRPVRYPGGRKEYNGRVERSHRTDDEGFYLPCLGGVESEAALLRKSGVWFYFYNLERPHQGAGMEDKPLFARLKELLDRKLPRACLGTTRYPRYNFDLTLQDGNVLLATYRWKASRKGR